MAEALKAMDTVGGVTEPDIRAKGTLRRFLEDWVFPRWREVVLALVLTSGLAATTGGYPLIIKNSFDTLLKGKVRGRYVLNISA